MTRERRRKCHHCGQLYSPDWRNRWHQRYCSEPACRQASKAASQNRWRASPQGRDYFGGTANLLRVQAWRKAHPGYGRNRRKKSRALQDHCASQTLVPPEDKPPLNPRVTRSLGDARPYAHGTGRAIKRFGVTTEHRFDHPAADTFGPADSRPQQREDQPWRCSNGCCAGSGYGGSRRNSVGSTTVWFGIGIFPAVRWRPWPCICSWSPSVTARA